MTFRLGCLISLLVATVAPSLAQTENVLFSFGGDTNGSEPHAGLTPSPDGSFYGTVPAGGLGTGLVYHLLPPAQADGEFTESIIYQFALSDGAPSGRVLLTKTGSLIVMTSEGGPTESGSVIELTPLATEGGSSTATTIYTFLGNGDGRSPAGTLIEDQSGNFFGVIAAEALTPRTENPVPEPSSKSSHFQRTPGDGSALLSGLLSLNGVIYGTT